MEGKQYYTLVDLDVYKLARTYSQLGWKIYERLDWQKKKIIGDQMITSADSVGANIAEGYGRFHYLDKNRFYYNARGSLLESKHWIDLLYERKIIFEQEFLEMNSLYEAILKKINSLIKSQQYQRHNNFQSP